MSAEPEVVDLDDLCRLDIIAAGLRYLEAGVGPLVPLVGKNPSAFGDDWWARAITDPDEWVRTVAADSRYTNIGWAQGYGTVALDFDRPDEAGEELLAVARLGARNRTRPGRGHRVFTTEDAYGASTAGFPTRGWGEVRGKGGQIVIWGPHPEDPDAFYRYDASQTVPPAPAQLLEWLAGTGDTANAADLAKLRDALDSVAERRRPRALAGIEARAAHVRAVLTGETTDHTVGLSRHDNLVELCCWAAREALAGRFALADAQRVLAGWWQTLGLPAHRAEVTLGRNEFSAAWQWALAQAEGDPERVAQLRAEDDALPDVAAAPANVDPVTGEVRPSDDSAAAPTIPEEFWTARPVHEAIRTAARSRLAPPDTVLGCVLARLGAQDHTLKLPPLVGGRGVGLSTFTAGVGAPGLGKSTSASVAAEIIPARAGIVEVATGSGEGLVEVLFDVVEEDGQRVRRQTRYGVIATIDEGTKAFEVAQRQGATLLSVLRTAWTDGPIGDANASAERRRLVDAGQYAYGVVLGVQPEKAGPLLDDAEAGTPQRFLWLAAEDPDAPDITPDWPEGLRWQHRHAAAVEVDLADEIIAEVRRHRLAQLRREIVVDPLDVHAPLQRLKVAGLLAQLDGNRHRVTVDDWRLAGLIVGTSSAVRSWVTNRLRAVAAHREDSFRDRIAGRTLHVENAEETRALAACVRAVANKVHRSGECSRRDLQRAPASRSLRLVAFDDVLARAAAEGYIVDAGEDRWKPGRVKP